MSASAISIVENATSTNTRDISVAKVVEGIRTGGKKLRRQVQQIRNRFEAELAITGDYKKAKLSVDPLKKQLPAVTWSGGFSQRANDRLIQHSGLVCADFDGLNSTLVDVREKLRTSPHLFALFISPSGDGLKAVFRVPADASKHAGSFRAVQSHVRELCGVEIDQSGKDVARLCFMSYDPEIYVNENATEITPLPEPVKEKPVQANVELPPDLSLRERIATQLFGPLKWSAEKGGYFCQCPGESTHTSMTGEKHAIVYLDKVPTFACQHESCKKIEDAFNAKLRSEIGKAERAARQESAKIGVQSAGDDAQADLTSLTSLADAEYPAPPLKAAFHGLAGEVVKTIEPYTEADSAALLVQFLVAFGNIIERMAYAVADGAWHYLNLFCVLVGETSKGRKGISLHHLLRLFALVDEDWKKNCLASGLSSGEGVIHAVRDEIKETKPVKEKGKFTGGGSTARPGRSAVVFPKNFSFGER